MNKVPPIGSRVRYIGFWRSFTGTVLEHYPADRLDANGDPIPGDVLPEE